MNDEYDNNTEHNFYGLDKSKRYKIEGRESYFSAIFLVIFGAVFLCAPLAGLISMLNAGDSLDVWALSCFGVFFAVGGTFIVIGAVKGVKTLKQRRAQVDIIKNCTLTDGVIVEYECRRSVSHHDDHSHTSYIVTLTYEFYDTYGNLRSKLYKHTYSREPNFYLWQNLMIAFTEADSLILSEFSLSGNDAVKFFNREQQRSADDFDGLTGELLDIDLNKPIQSYEISYTWMIVTGVLSIILIVYAIIFGINARGFFGSFSSAVSEPANLAVVALFLILPITLIIIMIKTIKAHIKSVNRFKKLMDDMPYFTYGKIFGSERTYRASAKKTVIYCYIDKWGERHTEEATSTSFLDEQNRREDMVVVAYTGSGYSTILSKYSFTEK